VIDESNEQIPFETEKYWEIAVRQRRWILAPFFGAGVIGFAVALLWPPVYQSQAVVLVEEQKVPTKYVTPNVVADVESRLQSMKEQILSRTALEGMIKRFNLYQRERSRMTMDELVDRMRGDIEIHVIESGDHREEQPLAFRIFFSAENPYLAQQVNTELTSNFIEKSLEARAQQSKSTTEFLDAQLELAKKHLEEQEEKLRKYKMQYLGELPQQEQSNLQNMNTIAMQLQSVTDSIARAEQQKIYLQSLRSEYQSMSKSDNGSPGAPSMSAADAALRDLRKQLSELEAKYTPSHPDVVRVKEEISQWEELKKKGADSPAPATGTGATEEATAPADRPALAEVESRLKAVEVEIANDKQRADKLNHQLEEVRGRLNLTPVREQEIADVTRDYQNSREYYQSLLQKESESRLASNLELHQVGEQFRIIDPPSLPDKPYKPNRPLILLGGWLMGLCLGIGIAGVRELRSDTLRSESDLQHHASLPVLVRLPIFSTSQQRRSAKLQNLVELAVVAVLTVVSLVVAFYTYRMS
jgi:protein tyrosine kinase modulator